MVCNRCGVDKPTTEFYADPKRKSGLNTICKDCVKSAVKRRTEENHDAVLEYHRRYYRTHASEKARQDAEYRARIQSLKTPCVKCGESRLYVIDFHHIDPKEKSFNINRKSCKRNFQVLKEETDKCVCLCRNCHAEFHHLYGVRPKDPVNSLLEYLYRKEGG